MPQEADEQTRAILDAMAASDEPKLHELSVPEAREMLVAASKPMEIARSEVGSVKDVPIIYDEGSFSIRLYSPENLATEPCPAIILYHGGGFLLGSVETHDTMARYLCKNSGRKVFSVEYRLAPEHKFPAGLHDCKQAANWVFENADELNVDTSKVSLFGDSAGANLCTGVAQLSQLNFQSLVLLYPCCDFSKDAPYPSRKIYGGGEYFLSMNDMSWILNNYAPNEDAENNSLISPMKCDDFSNWPSTLVITAGMDLLRDEGHDFYEKLKKAGVTAEYLTFDGTIHGFVSFGGAIEQGRLCLDKICQFLAK